MESLCCTPVINILYVNYSSVLNTYIHMQTSEDPKGGEKADHLRILGLKVGYAGEFHGFSFYFIWTRLKAGEAINIEAPMDTE